jgi:hypothetical protein
MLTVGIALIQGPTLDMFCKGATPNVASRVKCYKMSIL